MGIWALIQIFLQAPRAICFGYFHVDERSTVYGWPARIVGGLLLYIGLFWVVDVLVLVAGNRDTLPPSYLLFRMFTFLGSIVVAAVLCAVFGVKRRAAPDPQGGHKLMIPPPAAEVVAEEVPEEPPVEERRGRQGGWNRDSRDW